MNMSWLAHEWRLLIRSRLALAGLLLLLALSALATVSGLREVSRQQESIARLAELQKQELAAQRSTLASKGDAGSVAYYTFLGTWDAPAPAAFLALGLRDTAPYVLRVRALALQAQLHEGEAFNPELALAGRFDFAFVLVYLMPLFLIALLYDLISGERQAGRLVTLNALPGGGSKLWLRRAGLRAVAVFACLAVPMVGGAWASGMPFAATAVVLAAVLAYVAFWAGLALVVVARGGGSAINATALMGCWALLTLVLPAMANAVLAQAVPVRQGVELMLAQRQAVHAGWDLPREETLRQFFRTHPQWQNTAPLPAGFHWKWYYAFQQLGDESVAPQVEAYRHGLLTRQRWSERLGSLLPGVGAQVVLHRVAATDLPAQLAYQDQIAAFHARLRAFYYPYLFAERRFERQDFDKLPSFEPAVANADRQMGAGSLQALLLLSAVVAALGVLSVRRLDRSMQPVADQGDAHDTRRQ
jgi:ABC-2 type transport system permease protein